MIIWRKDFDKAKKEKVGGKAFGLGILNQLDVKVPEGFCISVDAAHQFFLKNNLRSRIDSIILAFPSLEYESATLISREISQLIHGSKIPDQILEMIRNAFLLLLKRINDNQPSIIARSSFVFEDDKDSSAAGQYLSIHDIYDVDQLIVAVKNVWGSIYLPSAILYRYYKKQPIISYSMAVLVQEYVRSKFSGVVYTDDIFGFDDETLIVEVNQRPSGVVNGEIDSGRYLIKKSNLEELAGSVPNGKFEGFIKEYRNDLVRKSIWIERRNLGAVDLEWLISIDDELYFVQARPLVGSAPKVDDKTIVDARFSNSPSGKLRVAKLMNRLKLAYPTMHVITHKAFLEYRAAGNRLPPILSERLSRLFYQYQSMGQVLIRSLYTSKNNNSNMMPASPYMNNENEYFEHIFAYWDSIVMNRLDDSSADVSMLVCNLDVPYASCISSIVDERHEDRKVLIEALFGMFDSIETNTHDVYEVNFSSGAIESKNIPEKDLATYDIKRPPMPIPDIQRKKPVLSDSAIAEISRQVKYFTNKFGVVRLEHFIMKEKLQYTEFDRDIILLQIDRLKSAETMTTFYLVVKGAIQFSRSVISGTAIKISSPEEINTLDAFLRDGIIICIDLSSYSLRGNMSALLVLCNKIQSYDIIVLYRGGILSHTTATLREFGIRVYPTNVSLDFVNSGEFIHVVEENRDSI